MFSVLLARYQHSYPQNLWVTDVSPGFYFLKLDCAEFNLCGTYCFGSVGRLAV